MQLEMNSLAITRAVGGAILLLAIWPSGADAHWQFTRWGMSADQVKIAAKAYGSLKPIPDGPNGAGRYVGVYQSGKHHFEATYEFVNGKLDTVTLKTTNGCGDLTIEMKSLYGKTVSETKIFGLFEQYRWQDIKRQNEINFLDFNESCTLMYSPMDVASRQGL